MGIQKYYHVLASSKGPCFSWKLLLGVFCPPFSWKKITRGLPKGRKAADDRAPTIEEIRKIVEYPDRRIKPIECSIKSTVGDGKIRSG